jgi:hypothetical protein
MLQTFLPRSMPSTDPSLWVITKFEEVAPGLSLTSQIRAFSGPPARRPRYTLH